MNKNIEKNSTGLAGDPKMIPRMFFPRVVRPTGLMIFSVFVLAIFGPTVLTGPSFSDTAFAQVSGTSSGPQNLTCSITGTGVLLQWAPASTGDFTNPTGYRI